MNRSREAYAREHGLSASAMAGAVANKRKLACMHNVTWLEFHYTGPVGFIPMPIGVMAGVDNYHFNPEQSVFYDLSLGENWPPHRDYCGDLPDHGNEIDRFEFREPDALTWQCENWLARCKQRDALSKPLLRTYKEVEEAIMQGYPVMLPKTEYYYDRAMSISKEIKQGIDTEGFYK